MSIHQRYVKLSKPSPKISINAPKSGGKQWIKAVKSINNLCISYIFSNKIPLWEILENDDLRKKKVKPDLQRVPSRKTIRESRRRDLNSRRWCSSPSYQRQQYFLLQTLSSIFNSLKDYIYLKKKKEVFFCFFFLLHSSKETQNRRLDCGWERMERETRVLLKRLAIKDRFRWLKPA